MRFLTFFALLTLAGTAGAQYPVCRTIQHTPSISYTPPGTTQHIRRRVDLVTAVLQINPAYASGYAPDSYDGQTQAQILSELRQLEALVGQLARPAPPPTPVPQPKAAAPRMPYAPDVEPMPAPEPVSQPAGQPMPLAKGVSGPQIGLAVLQTKCAACHQQGKADPDQRFVFLDAKSQLKVLTGDQKLEMLRRSYNGEMPPPMNVHGIQQVSDTEYAGLMALLGRKRQ